MLCGLCNTSFRNADINKHFQQAYPNGEGYSDAVLERLNGKTIAPADCTGCCSQLKHKFGTLGNLIEHYRDAHEQHAVDIFNVEQFLAKVSEMSIYFPRGLVVTKNSIETSSWFEWRLTRALTKAYQQWHFLARWKEATAFFCFQSIGIIETPEIWNTFQLWKPINETNNVIWKWAWSIEPFRSYRH